MSSLPNWDYLRALLAVARAGTLSGAAVRLGVRHSTVSRHLTALEEASGSKIVNRTPTGLTLTAAGERLALAAEAVESQIHLAQEDIGDRDLSAIGQVRIGAPDAVGAFFLAPRLAELLYTYPELNLQLLAMPRLFNLTKREADMAIVLSIPTNGRLTIRKLADYGLGLYASLAYLERMPEIGHETDLKRHVFIDYIDDLIFTTELDYLEEVAKGAKATFQSSNIIAQMNAARAGAGLAILPHFLARQFPDLLPVLPSTINLTRSWWLVVQEAEKDIARIRIVMDFIVSKFAQSKNVFF
ncbi:LysR family transcriptional regulator [Agrobacterium tumefaciens]|uniref:LysR family transcriptional regulator n=1 Tax=Agrobacterium tumefaciens TaxID=358 RepID=UPI001572C6E8|nr:LysR family transcriptional regulator [Agrobacterium tumefaciens]NTB94890.1 LysR family transcriptional regulator [Agrobacterium tumefaciens]NTC44011.1 LysR family transcriptional regulator [Agrobacterium tumefaciens]